MNLSRKQTLLRFAILGMILVGGADCLRGQYISADTYTRYELLAPETNSFRILYEVTETAPGAPPAGQGKVPDMRSVQRDIDARTAAARPAPPRARRPR